MRRLFLSFFLALFCFSVVGAQVTKKLKKVNSSGPAVEYPLVVSSDVGSIELKFGLDATATDGIDASLGESDLPPLPPTSAFDSRFVDDPNSGTPLLGNGIQYDYRQGTSVFNGSKSHFIFCQVGSGTTYKVRWDLPAGVTGVLNDVVIGTLVNKSMSGKDSLIVSKNYNTLKMTINYALDSPAKYILTPSGTTPGAGTNITISAQLADAAGNAKAVAGKIVTWSKTGTGGSFSSPTSTTNASGIATVTFTVDQTAGTVHTVTGTDNTTPTPLTGTTGNITVGPGAANKYLVTSSGSTPVVGTDVTITAQLADQYGNAVATSGKTVTWSKTGTGGSFSTATSTTNGSGMATVTFTVGQTAGTVHTVTGTDNNSLTGTSASITTLAGAATKYVVISSRYSPVAGDTVKITAQLADQYGNAVGTSGKIVTWTSTNGGTFASPTSTTNGSGIATVVFTTSAAAPPVTHVVTATDGNSLTGSTTNIVTSSGPAAKYLVTSNTYNPDAGAVVTITAQLADAGGNPKAEANKTVTWSATNGGSFSNPTSTTNGSGIATITYTVSQTSGTVHKVTATDNTSLTGTSADITTKAGTATKYLVTSNDNNPVAGTAVTITAKLTDQYNNAVKTAGKTITWSKSGTGGSFGDPTSTTDANGEATVQFTTHTVSGTVHTVTATDNNSLTGASGNITTKAGAATKYSVTSNDNNPVAGAAVTITAQLLDVNDNAVTTSGKIITWTKTGTGGSFSSTTSTTNTNGTATVQFTTHTVSGTIHTVTATDNSAPALTGTSVNIITKTGAASKYLVTSSDNNPIAGTAVTITAKLTDANNNAVATLGKTITWSKSGTGGSFGSPTSTTDANGEATVQFTTHTISGTVHTVTATDNNSLTGTSGNITTKAGSATKYLVTSSNNSPIAGSAVTISAQLVDVNNNVVGTIGKTVTWVSTNGGTFASPTSTTNASGLATVQFTTSAIVGTVHKVTGTDGDGLTGSTNPDLTTTAGPPTKYIITSSGYNPTVGTDVTITAQLADVANNPIKTTGKIVTWSKTGTGGTFSTTTSTTDANGIATVTFTVSQTADIVHNVTGTDNTTPTALTGTTSDITTKSDVASKYIVTSDEYSPFIGTQINITAQLADKYNNSIKTIGKTVTWTSTNAGTFDVATSTTDANGIATVKFTVSLTDGTIHTVTATDNTAITGISSNITTITLLPPDLVSPNDNAKNQEQSFSFLWRKVDMATYYQIQVSDQQDFSKILQDKDNIADTTTKSINFGYFEKLYWRVRAKNTVGKSNWSVIWSFTIKGVLPGTPVLSEPASGSQNISVNPILSWQTVTFSSSYFVQVSDKSNFSNIVTSVGVTTTSAKISGLSKSTTYYWRVNSNNDIGSSDYSDAWSFSTVDTILAPTDLTVLADTNITVTLSWKDNSNNESGFKIERKGTNDQNFVEINQTGVDVVEFKDSTGQEGKVYSYRVKAFNTEKQSDYSNVETITLPLKSIKAPTNLVVQPDSSNHMTIEWKDNSDNEKGFNLERESSGASSNIKLGAVSTTSNWVVIATLPANTSKYIDTDTKEGVIYNYRVAAFNDEGMSAPIVVKKPVLLLLAPSNLTSSKPNTSSVKLDWLDNTSLENGYIILRATKPTMQYKIIDSVNVNIVTYTDNNVLDGKSYYYQVYAYSGSLGASATTNISTVTFEMNAPTSLTAEQLKNENKIMLTWKDNSKSETKYLVERKETSETAYLKVAELGANVETYTDATVSNKKSYTYRIQCTNDESVSDYITSTDIVVGIKELAGLPTQFELLQNYPNPFNPSTKIRYSIPQTATVVITIYNIIGEKIFDLVNSNQIAGNYEVEWNASNYASGIYIYRINTFSNYGNDNFNYVRKMLLIK